VPNGAAGLYLLGRINQLSNRHIAAIAYYNSTLQLDPMMWAAFEELCALGGEHEAQQYLAAAGGTAGGTASSTAGAAPGEIAAAAAAGMFPGFAAVPGTGGAAAAAGGRPPGSPSAGGTPGSPSSSGFQPVATPSMAHQQQQHYGGAGAPGSPSGAGPMSTAATKTGLGGMFSWMDSGNPRGTAGGSAAQVCE
jgi:anaphase-promoting complex subunit 3